MTIPAGYKCNQWGWFWKESDNSGPYFLDKLGAMSQGLPSFLLTDSKGAGPNTRLRVDVGQTAFFAGREFRAFAEFNLAAGATIVYKFHCLLNSILESFYVDLLVGGIRVEARTGGLEGGVFATPVIVFPVNAMDSVPVPVFDTQTTIVTGGTHTGGTVRDVSRGTTGNNTNQASLTILEAESPIGRAAIPLYLVISNPGTGAAEGILKLRWEERPVGI